jgi:hypothetical protein
MLFDAKPYNSASSLPADVEVDLEVEIDVEISRRVEYLPNR